MTASIVTLALWLAQTTMPVPLPVTVEAQSWWTLLVSNFGIPGAMLAVVIFCMWKGWLITGREATDYKKRQQELTDEKNMWRDMALKHLTMTEQVVNTNQAVISRLNEKGS